MFAAKAGEFFGKVFGTAKAVDNVLDKDTGIAVKVGGFFNDLHYSEQEKVRDKNNSNIKRGEYVINYLKSIENFKLVQRAIVFIVMPVWLILVLNIIFAIWLKVIFQIDALTPLVAFASSEMIVVPTAGVFFLYLGGGFMNSARGKG